jgi:hypothetical protein
MTLANMRQNGVRAGAVGSGSRHDPRGIQAATYGDEQLNERAARKLPYRPLNPLAISPAKKPRGQDGRSQPRGRRAGAGCQDSARPAVNHNQRRVVPSIATAAELPRRPVCGCGAIG